MAKTFTQQELVSENLGSIDDHPGCTPANNMQVNELIDRIKNLRIRPSLTSVQKILEYSRWPSAV